MLAFDRRQLEQREWPKHQLSLLAKAEVTWAPTFPQGQRLHCNRSEGGGTFPGRWVMWVWPAHRLTDLQADGAPALKLCPANPCLLWGTFTPHLQAKTSLKATTAGIWKQILGLNTTISTTEQLNKKHPASGNRILKKSPVLKKLHIFNFDLPHALQNTLS